MKVNCLKHSVYAKALEEDLSKAELESYLAKNRISWKFITAKGPWQGWFYKMLVGLTGCPKTMTEF